MADYLDLDLGPVDADELHRQALEDMRAQAPDGWVPNPWIVWLLSAVARLGALILVLAGQVPRAIFRAFGVEVFKIPAVAATAASGSVTVTATSGQGGTLDAGAQIVIDDVAFQTLAPVTVDAAGTGSVMVQAINTGSDGNVAGNSAVLVSPSLVWVESVSLDAPTTGGTDGETDDQYVDRLPDEIGTLTSKAVLVEDVPVIARRDPEVYRAMAIDNYDAATPAAGVEGHITVIVMNDTGGDVSSPGLARVEDSLESGRILGITGHVLNATRTAVDVSVAVTRYQTVTAGQLGADVKQAILAALNPVNWGTPDGATNTEWVEETTLRHYDLVAVAKNVPGVRHVTDLKLCLHGETPAASDVTLDGPGAVPQIDPGDITVTVS